MDVKLIKKRGAGWRRGSIHAYALELLRPNGLPPVML